MPTDHTNQRTRPAEPRRDSDDKRQKAKSPTSHSSHNPHGSSTSKSHGHSHSASHSQPVPISQRQRRDEPRDTAPARSHHADTHQGATQRIPSGSSRPLSGVYAVDPRSPGFKDRDSSHDHESFPSGSLPRRASFERRSPPQQHSTIVPIATKLPSRDADVRSSRPDLANHRVSFSAQDEEWWQYRSPCGNSASRVYWQRFPAGYRSEDVLRMCDIRGTYNGKSYLLRQLCGDGTKPESTHHHCFVPVTEDRMTDEPTADREGHYLIRKLTKGEISDVRKDKVPSYITVQREPECGTDKYLHMLRDRQGEIDLRVERYFDRFRAGATSYQLSSSKSLVYQERKNIEQVTNDTSDLLTTMSTALLALKRLAKTSTETDKIKLEREQAKIDHCLSSVMGLMKTLRDTPVNLTEAAKNMGEALTSVEKAVLLSDSSPSASSTGSR